jgi:hypothetical protein
MLKITWRMIDVKPYIDKLEALKEYLSLSIEARDCPRLILRLFNEIGIIISKSSILPVSPFEAWFKNRKNESDP